ncbi:hypothetical protein M406DRAFT_100598 [Cryphonectria parasitica EP155]|uniref:Uncharacterized protein n=1 Tax=Cryphonectria parasitica (strain ATCC 38755 / EP155) TaxID=660469 RepID=A0A9P4YAC1_CRYP1|nr:uncharacterized protein M406DRAFT_100598 [Cryphonectria parasitica EP155]KAF3769852.1 hypothetical protein M406DRAFT_100598 [Cryphonectria parasitica EP155]
MECIIGEKGAASYWCMESDYLFGGGTNLGRPRAITIPHLVRRRFLDDFLVFFFFLSCRRQWRIMGRKAHIFFGLGGLIVIAGFDSQNQPTREEEIARPRPRSRSRRTEERMRLWI